MAELDEFRKVGSGVHVERVTLEDCSRFSASTSDARTRQ